MNDGSLISDNLLRTDHYDFELPKELIAQEPLENREDARLLTVVRERGLIDHEHVRDLDRILRPGDCLVLNDTKVVPAKLVGHRASTGGRWQGLVLETDEQGHWKLLAKTRGKIRVGEIVVLEDRQGKPRFPMVLLAWQDGEYWIGKPLLDQSSPEGLHVDERLIGLSSSELLAIVGRVPLPHYIRNGNMVDSDLRDYQTIYAKKEGAVAAPTAGLHFTAPMMKRIIDRGVNIATVTLHVGLGTFRPLATETLSEHQMHSECGSISQYAVDTINSTRSDDGRVIAVGTTTTRVLETAARDSGTLTAWSGETDLFIGPGYEFQIIDGLLTNFHLPRSTLIVLVRSFGGDDLIQRAYQEAIDEKYRFFSYGDAMLIL